MDTLSPVSKLSLSFQSFSPFVEDASKQTETATQTATDIVFKKPMARPTKRINICKNETASAQHASADKENAEPNAATMGPKTKRRNSVKRKASERSPFPRALTQSAIGISTRSFPAPASLEVPSSTNAEEECSPYKAPPVNKQRRATVSAPSPDEPDVVSASPKTNNPLKMTRNGLQTTSHQHVVRPRRMTHSEGDLPKFHICKLPLTNISSDLNCITPDTVAALITREKFNKFYDEVHVIDCRFGYEYDGGHILGAKNLVTNQDVEKLFMLSISPLKERICIIFHCEFSSHRGPTLCRFLRSWDRTMHETCYPELYYPELYVLEGGYKGFWEKHPELCEPRAYIPMTDGRFTEQMKSGLLCAKQNKRGLAGGAGGSTSRSRSCSINGIAPHPLDPTSLMTQSHPDLSIFTRRQTQKKEEEEQNSEGEKEEEEEETHAIPCIQPSQTLSRETRKKLQEEALSSSPKRSLSFSRDSCRTRVPPICFDNMKRSCETTLPFSEPMRVRKLQLDDSNLKGPKARKGGSAIDFGTSGATHSTQSRSCRVTRREIALLADFEPPQRNTNNNNITSTAAEENITTTLNNNNNFHHVLEDDMALEEDDSFLNL